MTESAPGDGGRPAAIPRSRIVGLTVLVFAALGVTLALRILPYQIDDAYINYRYAVNLATGHGFTFNPGQPPVEGFSSPLWLLGLAVAATQLPRESLPWCASIAGLLCYLFIVWRLGRTGAPRTGDAAGPPRAAAAMISVALFALLPTALSYAVTGLESLLFAAIVLVFAMTLAQEDQVVSGLAAGALALWARPEGGWLLVAMTAQLLAMGALPRLKSRRTLALGLMVVIGGLTVVAFRLAIFGSMLPNTYYAKSPDLSAGVGYLTTTLATPPILGLFIGAILGALFGGPVSRGYLGAGLAWAAAAVLEGGDWMPGGRLLLPALGLFTLAAGGLASLFRRGRLAAAASVALVLATLLGEAALSWRLIGSASQAYDSYRYEEQVLADWIGASHARSIALIDIGEIGFRTGLEIVDLAGLTDSRIARSPGPHLGKRVDLRYLFEVRAPDLLLLRLSRAPEGIARGGDAALASIAPVDAMSIIEGRILADGRLARDYRPLFVQLPSVPRRPLNGRVIYLRKGVDIPATAGAFRGVITITR